MQRRTGKGMAHITPPLGQFASMTGSSEKSARLINRRSFGVTNRIWAILLLFVFIVSFTRYVLPSAPGGAGARLGAYPASTLKSKNYLNKTAGLTETNPFGFCPVFGPGDDLGKKYGSVVLGKTRSHLGSSGRVQRVLHKALLGQPVTISVLGGSVSACHGAGDDPVATLCYPSRFFNWWNTVFPHPASELTNGAVRRTNSAYFGYCNAHHLPDYTDLIILEFAVSDDADRSTVETFELLVRSILLREDQPAVLILGHFSPQVQLTDGFGAADVWHNMVAQFYDVPHITTKAVMYPQFIASPNSIKKYFTDPVLANKAGHGILADVLIAYMQSQICTAWDIATGHSFESVPVATVAGAEPKGLFGGIGQRKGPPTPDKDLADVLGTEAKKAGPILPPYPQLSVPPSLISTLPESDRPFEEVRPFCASANDLINPLPPSLFYGSGWNAFHPDGNAGQSELLHYWYSTLPTSKLRIPINIGAGDVAVYYMKEPIGGDNEEASAIECWVDDNYGGAKVIESGGDVDSPTPALAIIDHFVAKGSHFVECALLGEEGQGVPAFKILGIFAT
ncbi:hypothetical protein FIBSPDRAFT_788380 [Athelia psychrophila]|uniref:Capsular associated protein n=1 Tax=Athelia psychrophila TaxID=1759441 RepID=A0A166JWM9_9AGAM|nr:hypothetical protein FIBSPDRAFT_788380 [Fibularhizoctonia sp. CBS 109695]